MKHPTPHILICAFLWILLLPACEDPESPVVVEETSIHERAAWSPDGLTIAFTNQIFGGQGIYLVDSSGSNLRLLKSGEGIGLSWSPDSKWIVFSANGSLHKIKATGDSLTQLTTSSSDIRPAWSPDGTRIVYRSGGIKLLHLATSQVTTLVSSGNFPGWTPGGLVLYMSSSSAGVNQAVYSFETIDVTGSQEQLLYDFTSTADCGFGSMNSAGIDIVFSARPFSGSDRAQIVIVNISTFDLDQLTVDGGDYPAWSPDGSSIVYTRTAKGDGGLWLMDADGNNKRRLTQP